MASSGGGRSPVTAVLDDLVDVRDRVAVLQTVLHESSPGPTTVEAGELVDGMMAKLSSAFSVVLGTGDGGVASSLSGAGRGPSGRRKRPGAASSGPHRRSSPRGRMKSPLSRTVTATTLTDGKSWRKYGQKQIHDSTNPRSYYRCTHLPDQGCKAKRHVQQSESNPTEYTMDYYGQHTCRDPSTFPSLIVQSAAAAPPPDCANLISFAPINGANSGFTASTSTSAFAHHLMKEAADHHPMLFSRFSNYYSSSPPAQEGVSSGSPSPACHGKFMQYGAGGQFINVTGLRTSPLTVGSAPAEYWPVVGVAGVDMDAGAGMDSFPSPPSSPGFLSGSLEGSFGNNVCDDDLFSFDS
ncbi:putative WRKY transcription factor 70 [Hordeum vulgare]|uniref:WRKY domain-containing protein n=1 Tax=Hordeum vulgare subsp. vulgare TaxID=112509 RepID=A0A8I6WNP5_HORVV|nr:probable WRKY transcription factor 72 [Hordeum vulgare subsp. vulgare]KAE8789195.1 putative WRKY transcription factor 70 [Hordeum vulgare]